MAHKKAGGSSRNGRDTAGRRLGVKKFGGEAVIAGNIIIRQRGTKWHPGTGVGLGVDHTIYAVVDGTVAFKTRADGQSIRVRQPGQRPQNNPVGPNLPATTKVPRQSASKSKGDRSAGSPFCCWRASKC